MGVDKFYYAGWGIYIDPKEFEVLDSKIEQVVGKDEYDGIQNFFEIDYNSEIYLAEVQDGGLKAYVIFIGNMVPSGDYDDFFWIPDKADKSNMRNLKQFIKDYDLDKLNKKYENSEYSIHDQVREIEPVMGMFYQ